MDETAREVTQRLGPAEAVPAWLPVIQVSGSGAIARHTNMEGRLADFADFYAAYRDQCLRAALDTGVSGNTGVATDILASRLKRLEAAGILRRERYGARPVRYEYFLTSAGQELFPILLSLREWGERQLHPDADPLNPVWHDCGAELHVETVCRSCREVAKPQDLRYRDGGG